MSIILGAMGGAGEALQNVGSTMLKSELDLENRRTLQREDSDLATARAKTLEEFKQSLANAPLNRLGATARRYADEQVPVAPRPVTNLSGELPLEEGQSGPPSPGGFTGDPGIIRRQIQSSRTMSEAEKAEALQQLDRQVAGDGSFEAGIIKGTMRRRTSDEALDAAVADAKVNDLPAYAAYEKEIGKPKREERRLDMQQDKEDRRYEALTAAEQRKAEADARKFAIDLARLEIQQGNLDATNRRIDALIEHWERSDETKANGKAGSPERLYSIVNAMNATIRDLNGNKPSASKEAERAEWQRQYDTAVRVRDRASALLDQNLGDRGAPPAPAAPAAAPAKPPASSSRPPLSQFMR